MTTIVTQEDVQRAAERLGIAGSPSCVHASLRSFGWVEGGAISVVEGLLAARCTVLVPTFSSFDVPPPDVPAMRPQRNGWDYAPVPRDESVGGRIFTPESMELDQEDMGAVSAAVLTMRNRVRGNHPLNSFTAVGPLAHDLIDGQEPTAVYRPLESLADLNGWVVLMGVSLRSLTLLHLAEKSAGRQLFRRWANDAHGRVMMVEAGVQPWLREVRVGPGPMERRATVGQTTCRAYPAKEALEAAGQAILDDPFITHCGNEECRRCRDAVMGVPYSLGCRPAIRLKCRRVGLFARRAKKRVSFVHLRSVSRGRD
jgi:aminoglycoside 3-N-acetyltransferase